MNWNRLTQLWHLPIWNICGIDVTYNYSVDSEFTKQVSDWLCQVARKHESWQWVRELLGFEHSGYRTDGGRSKYAWKVNG